MKHEQNASYATDVHNGQARASISNAIDNTQQAQITESPESKSTRSGRPSMRAKRNVTWPEAGRLSTAQPKTVTAPLSIPTPEESLLDHYIGVIAKRHSTLSTGTIALVIDFGLTLREANSTLSPAEWKSLTNSDRFPVEYSVACRYMKIAETPHITNEKNWPRLPMYYNALYEVSLLTESQFETGWRLGFIHAEATTRQIHSLRANPTGSVSVKKRTATEPLTKSPKATSAEIEQLASVLVDQNDKPPKNGGPERPSSPLIGGTEDGEPTRQPAAVSGGQEGKLREDKDHYNRLRPGTDGSEDDVVVERGSFGLNDNWHHEENSERTSFQLRIVVDDVTREQVETLHERIRSLLDELSIVGIVKEEAR
jgi:hypothetical protein